MNKQALIDLRDKVMAGDHRVGMWSALKYPRHPHIPEYARQAYVGSLDAVKAVHEAVLPGWTVEDLSQASRLAGAPWGCTIGYYDGSRPSSNFSAQSKHDYADPARSWLIAILEALIAMEDTDDE